MITKNNLKQMLQLQGFSKITENIYEKKYTNVDCSIEVDFSAEKIEYPINKGFKIGRETTCNFSAPENFVVLECIDRLLTKGYRPEDIELEKGWHLGHEAKGGYADICVYDRKSENSDTRNVLCIIECKKDDKEYDKELRNIKNDGGQLFSYWQQERSTKWLALYVSSLTEDISYKVETINCSDDKNILELSKKDATIKLFKNSYTVGELYDAWTETYEQRLCGDILFSEDTQAYNVGIKPLRKKDLVDFTDNDKIVNRFEEILRHNNVSDKENAFNRLVALFICKLVDEIKKTDNDEVEFQYKIGTDTYESLQDRLQKLHCDGMQEFMKEKIHYVPNDYAENVIYQYTGQNRKELIADLNYHFRILKFYTNNDFAFKDVHNEELFQQNGKLLVEVVQLFEKYRIIGSRDLQMLGDLFEQLLNKGFKQNEGQFFTPVPITRFIWDSLPLERIIKNARGINYPKIIDYACGAGHFLTEGFKAVNAYVTAIEGKDGDREWVEHKLYGIEKDYRLARVSKISLFMHGAGVGNIIFGDGLENYKEKEIVPESFDVLVANPPYAVSSFKPHLNLKENSFEILDKISNTGSEIETLFVERIAQLLKAKGVAAVILPSSILNKENESFIAARESLLRNFYIRAVVQFGSKTFGATGTNTVVMFLEKYNEPPKRYKVVADAVNAILDNKDLSLWEDRDILNAYLAKIDVQEEDYEAFICLIGSYNNWQGHKYFGKYVESFERSKIYIDKKKQKTFSKLPEKEQQQWFDRAFYEMALKLEKEKLMYFALVYNQSTLIISAPADNKGQEHFLGYNWSNRKGAEGIQVINKGGMLYNDIDRFAKDKLSEVVRTAFEELEYSLPDLQQYYYYVRTQDMLDFSGVTFNKGIKFSKVIFEQPKWNGKYQVDRLGNIAYYVKDKFSGNNVDVDNYITTDNMLKNKQGVKKYDGIPQISNATIYRKNDILVSNIRPYLKKIWLSDKEGTCSNDVLVFRCKSNDLVLNSYLYYILQNDIFFSYMMSTAQGIKMPRANKDGIMNFEFPIPSIEVQKQIIDEYKKADNNIVELQKMIENLDGSINTKFDELFVNKAFIYKTIDKLFNLQLGKTPSRNIHKYWRTKENKWISVADMGKYDRFTGSTSEYISNEAVIDTGIKIVPANTVIMSFKLTIGRTAITSEDMYTNEAIVAFLNNGNEYIDNDYLRIQLTRCNWTYGQMNAVKGMTLNQKSIGSMLIPVPPIELQQEFAEFVNDVEIKKAQQNEKLKQLKAEREQIIEKYFA